MDLSTVWCTLSMGQKAFSWVDFFNLNFVLCCLLLQLMCTALWSLGCVAALASKSAWCFDRAFFPKVMMCRSFFQIVSSGTGHPQCTYETPYRAWSRVVRETMHAQVLGNWTDFPCATRWIECIGQLTLVYFIIAAQSFRLAKKARLAFTHWSIHRPTKRQHSLWYSGAVNWWVCHTRSISRVGTKNSEGEDCINPRKLIAQDMSNKIRVFWQ